VIAVALWSKEFIPPFGIKLDHGSTQREEGIMEAHSRGYQFKTNGEDRLSWRSHDAASFKPTDSLSFGSYIKALFCIADQLYVATLNGGLYRIDGIGLRFDQTAEPGSAMRVVRCKIVEAN